MKRLGYPLALVFVSLLSVAFFTTVTAVTLASYAKAEKTGSAVISNHTTGEIGTVSRWIADDYPFIQ